MIVPRERNPERSRQRIVTAALQEFAAHGFAGARVEAIARRAGLNKQLISHYFGGKLALFQAVMAERRLRGGGELDGEPEHFPDALPWLFDRARADPEWIRVLLWEALEPAVETPAAAGAEARQARYGERAGWVSAEQAAGRLPTGMDPDLLFLTLVGAALYPVLLPDVCEIMTGQRPDSEAFADRYRAHLRVFASEFSNVSDVADQPHSRG